MMRRRKSSQWCSTAVSGGKIARVGDGGSGDAERVDGAGPVRVVSGVHGRLGHQGSDRVVAAQMAPDLLEHQVR